MDDDGLQVSFVACHFIHSSFVDRKAIAKLHAFCHPIARQMRKPKHVLRVLFKTLRVSLELNPSNMHVAFTIVELIVPSAAMKLR